MQPRSVSEGLSMLGLTADEQKRVWDAVNDTRPFSKALSNFRLTGDPRRSAVRSIHRDDDEEPSQTQLVERDIIGTRRPQQFTITPTMQRDRMSNLMVPIQRSRTLAPQARVIPRDRLVGQPELQLTRSELMKKFRITKESADKLMARYKKREGRGLNRKLIASGIFETMNDLLWNYIMKPLGKSYLKSITGKGIKK